MPPKSTKKAKTSKFEFWTELPNEMRAECIKRMDFRTRMQLRAASKQDKLLVESAPKYHFGRVVAELSVDFQPKVTCKNVRRCEVNFKPEKGEATPEFYEKAHQLVAQLLKFSNPASFNFATKLTFNLDVPNFLNEISNSAPFRFKKLILNCDDPKIAAFFLKNCNSLISFNLNCGTIDETKLIRIVKSPSVVNAKSIQFLNLFYSEAPYQLIKKWLGKDDLELGKTLKIRNYEPFFMEFLGKTFESCVVSKTVKTLRLRTRNSKKHILIRTVKDPDYHMKANKPIYFSFLVIPAELKESEYVKDDKWAKVVYKKEEARKEAQQWLC